MNFTAAGETHVGLVRKKNEDSFYCDAKDRIFAVADGLGGLPFGDLASKAVVQYLELWVTARRNQNWEGIDWSAFMKEMNHQVVMTGQISAHGLGIGTTLSMGIIRRDTLEISHIGDSRVYLLRNGTWKQLTIDHTLETFAKEQDQGGDSAEVPAHYKHTLTQCLGQRELIRPQFEAIPLREGDRLLFCSDGVSGPVPEDDLIEAMRESETPRAALDRIVELSLEHGAPDNLTAIVVFAE